MLDQARLAAYEVLTAVRADDAYTNLVLPQVLAKHGLTGRDAAFVTELAAGAIRRRGTYDAILDSCADRIQPRVRDALLLGVHQLLSMRVPHHAAISTTVDLVRSRNKGAAGFANAVLRKVSSDDLDGWIASVAPAADTDPIGHAVVAHSHPRWVVEALAAALTAGDRAEELGALLAADNENPKVTLVARPGVCTVAELIEAGGVATGRSPYAVELAGGDPGAIPAVAEGRAGVQDEGSQRVALALTEASLSGPDERWLDLCAGPGGKTALMAAVAAGRGARVLANEALPHRTELVARHVRAVRAGMLDVVTGDGTRPDWEPASFDRVLIDAPCSGLGALRRRPEARWRKRPEDLDTLVPLQRALLSAGVDSVRPGGVVVYATCSPVLAETRGVVDAVLSSRDDVREERAEQLWPHVDGSDAMFFSVIRRTP
ncbi:RsmB/NOP family class I SAM-dependent RNA methyltransferase [Nocardioides limicola]|uniref:RsmB/NOP family class I SAM-dependent RNA methyltransferase n=1 Tax=Nocardioides limicola TaxID=2803368 RepID=UPI00193B7844|nr:transcription antitermination factor NusB [Nocardioides sp. DJM-14]